MNRLASNALKWEILAEEFPRMAKEKFRLEPADSCTLMSWYALSIIKADGNWGERSRGLIWVGLLGISTWDRSVFNRKDIFFCVVFRKNWTMCESDESSQLSGILLIKSRQSRGQREEKQLYVMLQMIMECACVCVCEGYICLAN